MQNSARDPVCGMEVNVAAAAISAGHQGKTYYFCSQHCKVQFIKNPKHFVDQGSEGRSSGSAPSIIYTCPMHPEVRSTKPGSCPICGMALEPMSFSPESDNPEYREMFGRFWFSAVLAVPVVALAMGGHYFGLHHYITEQHSTWLQMMLATPIVLWGGWPFFVRGWNSVLRRSLNMFTLIAMGIGVAWAFSVIATVFPGLFPPNLRGADGSVAVYFEAAAVITVLVLLGQVLELSARERTSSAIKALLDLSPKIARRLRHGSIEEGVPLEVVQVGDLLRVRPGEKVPVDGVITAGRANLDESMMTGEAMPVARSVGSKVTGGTINRSSAFVMKAEKIGHDTVLARIVAMVAEAQRSRAPIQRLADEVSAWFVPAVIAVAAAAFFAWMIWGPEPKLAYALIAAVTVLIIACPCALGLATPMSIMVGVGRGSSAGVFIKNAEALERLEKIDTLVIDKTGTLTEGKPVLEYIKPAAGFKEEDLLALAASAERGSEHPLGAAIVEAAEARGIVIPQAQEFEAPEGKGVRCVVNGKEVLLGSARFLTDSGIMVDSLQQVAKQARSTGAIAVLAGINGKPAGIFVISDPVKPSAHVAVKALQNDGVKIVMLTGDNAVTAHAVAAQLGITEVHAEMLPQEKAAFVQKQQQAGRHVAMAGDGVNDAPALAAAEVGIAMGKGTDVAIESASITLVKGDLSAIVRARKLSKLVMRNIRQNLVFAFLYNSLGVPVAAGVLYPFFGVLLSPVIGAAAMSLSSVSVIANALRLRTVKL